jgi:hypothetical protein
MFTRLILRFLLSLSQLWSKEESKIMVLQAYKAKWVAQTPAYLIWDHESPPVAVTQDRPSLPAQATAPERSKLGWPPLHRAASDITISSGLFPHKALHTLITSTSQLRHRPRRCSLHHTTTPNKQTCLLASTYIDRKYYQTFPKNQRALVLKFLSTLSAWPSNSSPSQAWEKHSEGYLPLMSTIPLDHKYTSSIRHKFIADLLLILISRKISWAWMSRLLCYNSF